MYNYKFYYSDNKTIAVSSYAGKAVRGIAKCASSDEYDKALGEKLAAARCNARITKKREERAKAKYYAAKEQLAQAQKHFDDMVDYYTNARSENVKAHIELKELEESI